jgi:hypothetical protein
MSVKNHEKNQQREYKSPLRKLVTFFELRSSQWKEKYQSSKQSVKQLSNRVRYLESSKEQWKQKAQNLERELRSLKIKMTQTQQTSPLIKKKRSRTVETKKSVELPQPFQVVPFQHQYSIGHVMLYLSLVLSASTSLRGANRALAAVFSSFQLSLSVPTWHTGRLWLLRFGYYKLTNPKPVANNWVWIVDHTIQLGPEKCLVILGLQLDNLPSRGKCLKHEDLEPITLQSGQTFQWYLGV